MSEQSGTDVLICGAGAAGLTLAIDLARRGITLRLIDKLEAPFGGSRGKSLQGRSLEVFEDLGVVDRIAACGGAYPIQRVYAGDGSYTDAVVIETHDPTPAEPYGTPIGVGQFLTEAALRERLLELGYHAEFGRELTGFLQDEEGVTVRVRGAEGEETLRVRYLIGADGARSFVRESLGIGFRGKELGSRTVIADVHLDGVIREAFHRFNPGSKGNEMGLSWLPGTDLFQVQAPVPGEDPVDMSAEGLTRLIAERTRRNDIVVREVFWASTFVFRTRLADRYRVGRAFLAGDAAHTPPPSGGQGLNTSVQDAYNLGWKLAAALGGAPAAVLDSYEEERLPIGRQILDTAEKTFHLMEAGSYRRGRELSQFNLGYPQSSLSLERPARVDGIRAGYRAPDAPVQGAGGQPTRLFRLFQGPHWTLLGYEVERLAAVKPRAGLHIHAVGPRGDIVDSGGHFREAYGLAPGNWVLVRPDGYIGAFVSSNDVAALEEYLQRVGLKRSR